MEEHGISGRELRGEPLRCPVDGSRLVQTERAEILIDACPECRGVWLDRGELDKIIDRAGVALDAPGGRPPQREERGRERYDDDDRRWRDDSRGYEGHGDPRRRRKRSFLDDMFDFD